MATLKSGVVLAEDEKLVMEIEAELEGSSSNPIVKLIWNMTNILRLIFGIKTKGFWVITDKRVIELSKTVICWCISTGQNVKYLIPSIVNEVGFTRSNACVCCCPVFYLYYDYAKGAVPLRSAIQLKDVDEAGACKAADTLYKAIFSAKG